MTQILTTLLGILLIAVLAGAIYHTVLNLAKMLLGLLLIIFATLCEGLSWAIRKIIQHQNPTHPNSTI